MTVILAALLVALAVGVPTASAVTPGSINEFSSGLNSGSVPQGIAPGPDGAIWFTDRGTTPAIGRFGPGGISESSSGLPAGSSPGDATPGPDGNTWFIDEHNSQFGRVTPAGEISEFGNGLPVSTDSEWVTTGADGNLWFTDDSAHAIGRLTPCRPLPCTPAIHEFSPGLSPSSSLGAIAQGSDGNMWFIEDVSSTYKIGRITPSGHIDEFTVGTFPSVELDAIAQGPDGNLWFTDAASPAIGRVIPCKPLPCTPNVQEFSSGLNAGSHPFEGIASGPDGNVWFTDNGSSTAAIGRVIPCTPVPACTPAIHEFSSGVSTGNLPSIAAGSDGNMWFADSGAPAIGRVGTGAPAALKVPPTVTASPQAEVCGGQTWSSWSGEQPSTLPSAADGYQWLLDGAPLVGQTKPTFTPTAAEVGHKVSCRVTVTYPLPLFVTTSAASAQITILGPPKVKITKAKTSSKHHTAKFSFKALGSASGLQCALVRKPKKHHKKSKPHFASCKSPKRYKHLKAGKYTFEVRAVTAGVLGKVTSKNFRIA